jgi:hypothetical protein
MLVGWNPACLSPPTRDIAVVVRENISMKNLFLIAAVTFALAIGAALSQPGFAQTNVTPSGIFQVNVAKSKFPGAPLKSQTAYWEGQKAVAVGIDAQGNPRAVVYEVVEDGKPHPVKGFPLYDAMTYTRVNAYTLSYTATKDGKVVQTGTWVTSADGKTFTANITNTANGQQIVLVHEKQ